MPHKWLILATLTLMPSLAHGERAYENNDNYQGRFYQRLASQCIQRAGASPQCTQLLETSLLFIDDAADVHLTLGQHYAAYGQRKKALTSLVRAVELNPELWAAYTALGDLHLGAERIEEAQKYYGKFQAAHPDEPLGHYLMATTHAVALDEKKAIDALKIAVDKGFQDGDFLRQDPRWRGVIGSPELDALLESAQPAP